MFKNLLVPTDGSKLSRRATRKAVDLAKATGARVTGFHVAPSYEFEAYKDFVAPNFVLPNEYKARVEKVAQRHLRALRKLADAAGVQYAGHYAMCNSPAEAINALRRQILPLTLTDRDRVRDSPRTALIARGAATHSLTWINPQR